MVIHPDSYGPAEIIVPMYTVKSSIPCANTYSRGFLCHWRVYNVSESEAGIMLFAETAAYMHAEGQCIAGEQDD